MKKIYNKNLHLPVIVEEDETDGYVVSCPVFEGCYSQGKTIDEALKNIREAIELCIEEEAEKVKSKNQDQKVRIPNLSIHMITV